MKRFFLITAMALLTVSAVRAQEVPVDPQLRIGQLENGLTYYIRHNEEPAGQANFYIAQKVGSILEDENQRGLAHFLEHMCFNGTEHFPGNNVIKYCESIGVKFGADLNAYTSVDETVYNIDNVPVATVPSSVDSCLWILHDWADGLLLESDDIDHERGVIHEEWRSRMDAQLRMYEVILPEIYPNGNRYGARLPIGTMEVVDNFPYQAIRDYYEKWYRPDQQGVVVVGDIDVDAVEAKIKSIFGTIAKPVDPAERFYVQIEDNSEPIISIAKDKEQPYAISYIMMKHDVYPVEMRGDLNYVVYSYAVSMADRMMAQRLEELHMSPDCPFIQASVDDEDFFLAKTKKAYFGAVVSDEKNVMSATTTVYREMLRALRNGFTESEYQRACASYLAQAESAYNQKDKVKSAQYCSEYVRHFIDREPVMGIETEFALAQQLTSGITVDMVNQIIASFLSDGNLVVAFMLPDKEGVSYPTKDEFAAAYKAVAAEDIAPYVDEVSDEPLLSSIPAAGKVKKVKESVFGYKMLKLSNGATVYLKNTDFNKNEIIMTAYSAGGTSLYSPSESVNLKTVGELFSVGGVGSFTRPELLKVLAGKKVSVTPYINVFGEGMNCKSTPKDLETMMQLNYLFFTSLRTDYDAFQSQKTKMAALLQNAEANPITALQDSLYKTVYTSTAYIGDIKSFQVDQIDYDRVMGIARERFANAADFTFVITGAFDEQTLIPMIEQYIASLPAAGRKEKADRKAADFTEGLRQTVFTRQMEVPMATIAYFDSGKLKYTLKNRLAIDLACQALSTELLEEIREKEGGTYSIQASGDIQADPINKAFVQIVYQAAPDKYEQLNSKVEAILDKFAAQGPSQENLTKGKEYIMKNHMESLNENSYYESALRQYLDNKIDVHTAFDQVLGSITAEDVRTAFKDMLSQGHFSKVIMVGSAQ